MKLTGISIKKLEENKVLLKENIKTKININHSRNNTTISNEGLFYTEYGVMRDIVLGTLCKFKLVGQKFTQYHLYINGKKIDFIDNVYALEKLVEFSESVILLKSAPNNEVIPWLIELD